MRRGNGRRFAGHRSADVTPTVTKVAAGAVEHVQIAVVPGVPGALQELERLGVWSVGLDERGPETFSASSSGTGRSPSSSAPRERVSRIGSSKMRRAGKDPFARFNRLAQCVRRGCRRDVRGGATALVRKELTRVPPFRPRLSDTASRHRVADGASQKAPGSGAKGLRP